MKKFSIVIFLAVLGFTIFAHADNRMYRVIEATPTDFIDALKTKTLGIGQSKVGKSRLQKFFVLTSKQVSGADIEMNVQIKTRMLPDALAKHTAFTIRLHELKRTNEHVFRTEFILAPNMTIDGLMKVSKHSQGALLEFDVQHTTVPLWIFDKAMQVIFKLNLASAKPIDTK